MRLPSIAAFRRDYRGRLVGSAADATLFIVMQPVHGNHRILPAAALFLLIWICSQNDRIFLRIEGLKAKLVATTLPFHLGLLPLDPVRYQGVRKL